MRKENHLGGTDRFSTNSTVKESLSTIASAATPLSELVSYTSPDYDGLVVFSHTHGAPIAVPLEHVDAADTARDRHTFRNHAILGRRVLMRSTALAATLLDNQPVGFQQSEINHDMPQMLYPQVLSYEGATVGVIQHSFTPVDANGAIQDLPNEAALHQAFDDVKYEVETIAQEVTRLQNLSRTYGFSTLAAALEYKPPIAPNAYAARWNIANAERLSTSYQSAPFYAYLSQIHGAIRHLAESYQQSYGTTQFSVEQAHDVPALNGGALILPIRENFNTYDTLVRADLQKRIGEPLITNLQKVIETVGAAYHPDLSPEITIEHGFRYIEPDALGHFVVHKLVNQRP